jgi:riboflavin transporter FmnP
MGMKKSRKILVCTITVLATVLASFFVYVSNYYHALPKARTYLCSEKNLSIVNLKNGDICFVPASSQVGIIFYPGGKVDYKAYAPLINYQDGDYRRFP